MGLLDYEVKAANKGVEEVNKIIKKNAKTVTIVCVLTFFVAAVSYWLYFTCQEFWTLYLLGLGFLCSIPTWLLGLWVVVNIFYIVRTRVYPFVTSRKNTVLKVLLFIIFSLLFFVSFVSCLAIGSKKRGKREDDAEEHQ